MDCVLSALERHDAVEAAKAMRRHIGNIAQSFAATAVGKGDADE